LAWPKVPVRPSFEPIIRASLSGIFRSRKSRDRQYDRSATKRNVHDRTSVCHRRRCCKVEGAVIPLALGNHEPILGSPPGQRTFHRLYFSSLASRLEPPSFQELSYAERPKDTAPIQIRCATCFPPKAVDAECRPPQIERLRKRATKLRAVSRASPRRSPVWECHRGGELLPTRRTLLQIDDPGPRRGIVTTTTRPYVAVSCHSP
jgi:hypothetical protein